MRLPVSRRVLGTAAFAAAVTLGSGLLGASPAAAQAPADQCGSASNGTEWIPDRGPGWDFAGACQVHDACYGSKPYGSDSVGRHACDLEFLDNARNSCGGGVGGFACRDVADHYYLGIRIGAGGAFDDARPPIPIVTVGEPETVPPTPIVTVGEPETIPTGGGGGGGGYTGGYGGGGYLGGGSSGGSSGGGGIVTVGEPEMVDQDSK